MSREKDWQVGDRVQWIDWESPNKEEHGTIYGGAVSALTKATREKRGYYHSYYDKRPAPTEEYTSHVTVKWDDGTEETLDAYMVSPEDSEIEREFRKVAPTVADRINEKLALANKYLSEAEQIADENGVPFSSSISGLGQDYFPRSFTEKWEGVSKEVMQDVTQTYNEHDSYYGWVHSAVC